MAFFLKTRKRLKRRLGNQNGQTVVEYLLLMAACFITSYLMITGPFATFTSKMLNEIRASLNGITQHGERDLKNTEFGLPNHPAQPKRFRAMHF